MEAMNRRNEQLPELRRRLEQAQQELKDAQETLAAIRNGEIDALVVDTAHGKRVYTLQGADEPYRLMIERMHQGAATLTEQGIILYANRQLAKLLDQPLEKVIGTDFRRCLHPEHVGRFEAMLAVARHKYRRAEFDLPRGQGRSLPVQLSLSAMTVDQNQELCAVVSDLSEHRQHEKLRRSEAYFREIAQATPQVVWTADPAGIPDFVNDRWCQYSGLDADDTLGEHWILSVHPDDRPRIAQEFERFIEAGNEFEMEHRLRRHDGVYRWHLVRAIPIRDRRGAILKWLGTSTDIETQKQTEASLLGLAHTLEQRVAERTALAEQRACQLQQAAADLVRAEQRERKRISQTLHDHLQQMLVTAKFQIGMIPDTIDQPAACQRLLDGVDQLLGDAIEVSRDLSVDLSPPVLNERGLSDALHWLAGRFSKQHKLTVEIRIQQDPEAERPLSDPLRHFIFYSVRELLLNAVKHAHCSKATVTLDRRDDNITLSVADNGRGCDPKRMRPAADPAKQEGTGLANMRQRAELWGGRLRFQPVAGKGCRIALQLPALFAAPPARAAAGHAPGRNAASKPPPAKRSPEGVRILLADDHAMLRDALASLLARHGFTVVGQADDGQQAIDLAIALQPDIVLMDVRMPNVDGIEATGVIREKAPRVRVIGLSMHNDTNTALAMRNAGAVGFITKSSPADRLIQTIRTSLKARRKPTGAKSG